MQNRSRHGFVEAVLRRPAVILAIAATCRKTERMENVGTIFYTAPVAPHVLINAFFLYSFLGFLIEVAYTRLCHHPKQDRKCLLFLPLCPVYGLGALAVLSLPALLLRRPLLVFLAGALVATLVEYVVAVFYEKGVGVRFWEYDQQPGNLSGRICPLYTLFWGALSLLTVYGLQPLFSPLLARIPLGLTQILFLLFAADGLLSLFLLHRTGSTDCLLWYRRDRPVSPGQESM